MIFTSPLTWILLLPVIGALAAMVTPARFARWLALIFAAATFVLSMVLFFQIALNGYNFGNLNSPQYPINLPWINFTTDSFTFRINYFLGGLCWQSLVAGKNQESKNIWHCCCCWKQA